MERNKMLMSAELKKLNVVNFREHQHKEFIAHFGSMVEKHV